MSVPLRSPRAWVAGVLVASALVLVPSTARATYTGVQDIVTLGRMTVGAGWIVVPELEQSVDPGFIDGTPSMTSTSSLQIARLSGRGALHFDDTGVPYQFSLAMGAMSVAGTHDSLVAAWVDRTNGERIDTSTLNAKGQLAAGVDAKGELTNVIEQPAMPASGSFSLDGRAGRRVRRLMARWLWRPHHGRARAGADVRRAARSRCAAHAVVHGGA